MKKVVSLILLVFVSMTVLAKKPEPFFFIQITDPQMGFGEKGEVARSVRLLNETVDAINRLHPAFVVVTGDMVHTWYNEKEFNAYKECMSRLDSSIPVYTIPGNHDMKPTKSEESVQWYLANFGPDHFAFKYKGSFFIGYNSNYIKDGPAEEEVRQFEWLEKELKKQKRAKHRFVFTHCSIIKEDVNEKANYFCYHEPYRAKYLKLCKDYNVDAVFSGHYHRYRTVMHDGTRHVTCTASGHPLGDGFSGINVVTVYPDHFTYEVVPPKDAVNPLGK